MALYKSFIHNGYEAKYHKIKQIIEDDKKSLIIPMEMYKDELLREEEKIAPGFPTPHIDVTESAKEMEVELNGVKLSALNAYRTIGYMLVEHTARKENKRVEKLNQLSELLDIEQQNEPMDIDRMRELRDGITELQSEQSPLAGFYADAQKA